MTDLFKGFEQLLELAKVLEEKAEKGELKTEVQFRTSNFSNMPRQGNIPQNDIGKTRIRTDSPQNSFKTEEVQNNSSESIVTPPPVETNPDISLKDIGGLKTELKELRELVEIPLKRPDIMTKLGLEPPSGVLLVGPPGTGKTLTARTLAEELNLNYIAINGPEVLGKYYGEAEAKLRGIFEKASKSAPCLIFIDEIDSLAPDRSTVEGEVEKRLVAQLLGLMDGFGKTEGVLVLAATNLPDRLDPALRRPGRFDREVVFRVPDREGRIEILQILTRTMPLEKDIDLAAIADLAVGFVGADIKALCQKSAYIALRRQVPSINEPIPDNLTIIQQDFLAAIAEIKPSVLRSVAIESPNINWDDIGGLVDVKQKLQESVEGSLLYPELYQKTLAQAPRGILLWGPPGTGKTLLAKAVASQARANFIAVNGPELLSKWVGAAEQSVRELFRKARQAAPCVIFLDEIDTLAPARGNFVGDSGISDRVVGQLLTEMDGLATASQIIIIAATNRPDEIEPALLRAGRLDLHIKVDLPNLETRLAILEVHNRDRPLQNVNLSEWAKLTEGWNGADLYLLTNQSALEAIRRYRKLGLSDLGRLKIIDCDFKLAYDMLLEQKS